MREQICGRLIAERLVRPLVIVKVASSEESVGEGERQRCLSLRNLRNFLQVESNDLC